MPGGKVPAFIHALWSLLTDYRWKNIIRFTSDGSSFVILDENGLAEHVLPVYFSHSNTASFGRQLNFYNFKRVMDDQIAKEIAQFQASMGLSGPQRRRDGVEIQVPVYSHKYFHRDHPELLPKVIRKTNHRALKQIVESRARRGVPAGSSSEVPEPLHSDHAAASSSSSGGLHMMLPQFGGASHATPGSDYRSPPPVPGSHGLGGRIPGGMMQRQMARGYPDGSASAAGLGGGAAAGMYGLPGSAAAASMMLPDDFHGNPSSMSATRFSQRRRTGMATGKRGRPAKPDPVLDAPEGITPTGVGAAGAYFPVNVSDSGSSGMGPSPMAKRRAAAAAAAAGVDSRPLLSMYDQSALASAAASSQPQASNGSNGSNGSGGAPVLASSYSPNVQEAALQLLFASNLQPLVTGKDGPGGMPGVGGSGGSGGLSGRRGSGSAETIYADGDGLSSSEQSSGVTAISGIRRYSQSGSGSSAMARQLASVPEQLLQLQALHLQQQYNQHHHHGSGSSATREGGLPSDHSSGGLASQTSSTGSSGSHGGDAFRALPQPHGGPARAGGMGAASAHAHAQAQAAAAAAAKKKSAYKPTGAPRGRPPGSGKKQMAAAAAAAVGGAMGHGPSSADAAEPAFRRPHRDRASSTSTNNNGLQRPRPASLGTEHDVASALAGLGSTPAAGSMGGGLLPADTLQSHNHQNGDSGRSSGLHLSGVDEDELMSEDEGSESGAPGRGAVSSNLNPAASVGLSDLMLGFTGTPLGAAIAQAAAAGFGGGSFGSAQGLLGNADGGAAAQAAAAAQRPGSSSGAGTPLALMALPNRPAPGSLIYMMGDDGELVPYSVNALSLGSLAGSGASSTTAAGLGSLLSGIGLTPNGAPAGPVHFGELDAATSTTTTTGTTSGSSSASGSSSGSGGDGVHEQLPSVTAADSSAVAALSALPSTADASDGEGEGPTAVLRHTETHSVISSPDLPGARLVVDTSATATAALLAPGLAAAEGGDTTTAAAGGQGLAQIHVPGAAAAAAGAGAGGGGLFSPTIMPALLGSPMVMSMRHAIHGHGHGLGLPAAARAAAPAPAAASQAAAMTPTAMLAPPTPMPQHTHARAQPAAGAGKGTIDPMQFLSSSQEIYILSPVAGGAAARPSMGLGSGSGGASTRRPGSSAGFGSSLARQTASSNSSTSDAASVSAASTAATVGSVETPFAVPSGTPATAAPSDSGSPMVPSSRAGSTPKLRSSTAGTTSSNATVPAPTPAPAEEAPATSSPTATARFRAHRPRPLGLLRAATQAAAAAEMGPGQAAGGPGFTSPKLQLQQAQVARTALAAMPSR